MPLMIRDRTRECSDRRVRILQRVDAIVIHRISLEDLDIPDAHLDGPRMCAAFQDPAKLGGYTGRENPYALLVRHPEGMIEQCTPLKEVGAHAKAWNKKAIGVAVVGDFRKLAPTSNQWHGTALLAATLSQSFGGVPVLGHTELGPRATRDQSKRCPGALWPMDEFRRRVVEIIRNNRGDLGDQHTALSLLARAGAILGG